AGLVGVAGVTNWCGALPSSLGGERVEEQRRKFIGRKKTFHPQFFCRDIQGSAEGGNHRENIQRLSAGSHRERQNRRRGIPGGVGPVRRDVRIGHNVGTQLLKRVVGGIGGCFPLQA